MKYRLTEDCKMLGWKKGQIFEDRLAVQCHESVITDIELSLLLKTGILEEVKEEEWPKIGDKVWFMYMTGEVDHSPWNGDLHQINLLEWGNIFRSETAAKEASEKIKTLLLSLKK